jgi:hypothetical protein
VSDVNRIQGTLMCCRSIAAVADTSLPAVNEDCGLLAFQGKLNGSPEIAVKEFPIGFG